MTIGAIGANPLLLLNFAQKAANAVTDIFNPRADEQANTAGPQSAGLSMLPSSQAMPLSFESILQLQSLDEPAQEITAPSATDIFLEEARKNPMERLREQIMKELGVSEADLAALPPEERRAMEDRIRQLIEEKLRQGMGVDNAEAGSTGALLQEFV
jgi:hypothetical protein